MAPLLACGRSVVLSKSGAHPDRADAPLGLAGLDRGVAHEMEGHRH
jgi:hypothetical protein